MVNNKKLLFFTLISNNAEIDAAHLLVNCLRTFGGEYREAALWVFSAIEKRALRAFPFDKNTIFVPLEREEYSQPYFFTNKVGACAQVEKMVDAKENILVWLNPMTLILQEPAAFQLRVGYQAAFRPVHIQNIGSSIQEKIDGYWGKIYTVVGRDKDNFALETLLEKKYIRPYFNSHLFSIDPEAGLLQEWQELFSKFINNNEFQVTYCVDVAHQVFLHQAILSALLEVRMGQQKIDILPEEYSYPLHLHAKIEQERQIRRLDDLVCPVYEEEFHLPESLAGLEISPALLDWLQKLV